MKVPIFLLPFLGLVVGISCGWGAMREESSVEQERQKREGEELVRRSAMIGTVSVSVPVGRFLLIRNGSDFCAVRFTEFHREPNKATRFSPPDDSQYAEHEWFYRGDGSGDLIKPVESGHGKLYRKPAVGLFHPFVWPRGRNVVRCGPFRLGWDYPTQIGFNTTYRKEDDVGNEIAPTKWKEIREVNAKDPRLKWYRLDYTRKEIDIPIEQLW